MLTKAEREFIKTNTQRGVCQAGEIGNAEDVPYIAIPNMRREDGTIREFTTDEIFEALGIKTEE